MALIPRRNPLTSLLNFAADRDREANSIGDIITQIAGPALGQMGVKTEETAQPAVMRGPVPTAQPLGAMTGPALAPTPVMSDEELKANVFPGESGGDYNALFGYANRPGKPFEGVKLTDMTVNEVLDFTKPSGPYGQWVKSQIGRVSTPTGAFQTVGTTLKDAVQGLGLTGDEPYNEATQDAVGRWIFENQGPEAWEAWGKSGGAVSAGGGDARLGGGMGADTLGGNNVEDILAQLYPQMSPEDEKRQRRKDFFAAASQGFSALSQGRPIDFSNIQANQENRKRQAVLDMRERERARSAASLVYSQTGDRDLAAGIATGAISYGDVVSERERKRVEAEADRQRVATEQANGRLTGIVEKMWPDLGLPDSVKESVLAGIAAGDDPNTIFTLNEQAKVAEAAREADEEEATAAATRAAAIEAFSTEGGPIEQYAARLLALDPTLTVDQALERSTTLMRPAGQEGFTLKPGETRFGPGGEQIAALPAAPGGVNEVADIAKANMLFEGGATNPATNQPFTSASEALAAIQFYKPTNAAAGGVSLNFDAATGNFSFTNAGGATQGGAPTAGGGVVEVAKPEAGTATVVQDGVLTAVPVEGAIAPEQAKVELDTAKQALAERTAAAAPELEIKQLQARVLRAEAAVLQANQTIDLATKEASLANIQADLERKQTELATLENDAAKQQTAEYTNASRSFSVFENAAKDVLKDADNAWTTGTYGKIAMSLLPDNFATERSSFLEAAKQMGSQAMLSALAEAKAAGVTLTPVSNLDVGALGASQSRLSNPEKLTGEDIRKEVVFQLNFAKDALVGPKDLTRVDEFGQPYKTNADTLGLTEDTFARHWREIPPSVAEAWRNGELDALPTDDPLYAEAADTLNQHINNWQTYQGDLDRATVGVLPTPPEGIAADDWPDIWLELSVGERAAYRKQAKEGN
jgi:hypothetical protein